MGGNPEQSELEKVFGKKEEAVKAKEAQEKKPEAKPAEPEIIDEQQVTAQIDKAKKEIENTFLSDESKKVMSEALDKLIAKQGKETEGADTATREALTKLFNDTKTVIEGYKAQEGVKEVYDPLNKLFGNKRAYLEAINLEKYGVADEGDQGYWATIQKTLEGVVSKDDITNVQTILGLEPDGKIGPKTIDATWKMLTGEGKDVKNVIREKGDERKTVKGKQEDLDKILKKDVATKVTEGANPGQPVEQKGTGETQSGIAVATPLVAAEGEKQAPAEAPLVTEKDVKIVLKGTYNFIKPEIIDQSEVRITNTGETSIETKYVSPSGGELLFEGIWGEPALDKITIKLSKGNDLSEFIVKGKEDAAKADKKTVITSESLPNDQKEVSVFDENGNVRTEFTQAELGKLLTHKTTVKNPCFAGWDNILLFGPENITTKTNFNPNGRETITLDITEVTKADELTIKALTKEGKLKARKISLPKPQKGDMVSSPQGIFIYTGNWDTDKRKAEKKVTIKG